MSVVLYHNFGVAVLDALYKATEKIEETEEAEPETSAETAVVTDDATSNPLAKFGCMSNLGASFALIPMLISGLFSIRKKKSAQD